MNDEQERRRKFRTASGMSIALLCFMFATAMPLFGDTTLKPARIVALVGLALVLSVYIREAIKNRPR